MLRSARIFAKQIDQSSQLVGKSSNSIAIARLVFTGDIGFGPPVKRYRFRPGRAFATHIGAQVADPPLNFLSYFGIGQRLTGRGSVISSDPPEDGPQTAAVGFSELIATDPTLMFGKPTTQLIGQIAFLSTQVVLSAAGDIIEPFKPPENFQPRLFHVDHRLTERLQYNFERFQIVSLIHRFFLRQSSD